MTLKYGKGYEFTAKVRCTVDYSYDNNWPYLVDFYSIDGSDNPVYLGSDQITEEQLEELIFSSAPEERKQFQQEKVNKLKQQLEEEKSKLEKM